MTAADRDVTEPDVNLIGRPIRVNSHRFTAFVVGRPVRDVYAAGLLSASLMDPSIAARR